MQAANEALELGIQQCRPGAPFKSIGAAIHSFVKSRKLSVSGQFTGHGIGKVFHRPPWILHISEPDLNQLPTLHSRGFLAYFNNVNIMGRRRQIKPSRSVSTSRVLSIWLLNFAPCFRDILGYVLDQCQAENEEPGIMLPGHCFTIEVG